MRWGVIRYQRRAPEVLGGWVRFVGAACIAVYVWIGVPDVTYSQGLSIVAGAAVVYAAGALGVVRRTDRFRGDRLRSLSAGFEIIDCAFVILLAAMTGMGSSPILVVLLMVVTMIATTFGTRAALASALTYSAVVGVMILVLPRPAASLLHRAELAGWWMWLLLGTAVLAGGLSTLVLEAQRSRVEAEAEACVAADQLAEERRLRESIESAQEAQRDLLRIVCHELRPPIVSLEALTRAAAAGSSSGRRDEALELIREHATHLERMLAGVQQVSQAGGLSPTLHRTDACLARVVQHAAAICGFGPDDLVLIDDLGSRVVSIDVEKVTRILVNLLDNAKRHSPPHEPVEVHLRRSEPNLELTVSDRGPGMPGPVAVRAFERGVSIGDRPGSSGLGLWIVRELADVLGGRVRAEPRPVGGLVMSVVIPAVSTPVRA